MKNRDLSARQMAQNLHMDPSQLSRLRSGEIRDLSGAALGRLLSHLAETEQQQVEILNAYLSDKLAEASLHPDAIRSSTQYAIAERAAGAQAEAEVDMSMVVTNVDKRLAAALHTLGAAAKKNRRLRTILLSLVNYITG